MSCPFNTLCSMGANVLICFTTLETIGSTCSAVMRTAASDATADLRPPLSAPRAARIHAPVGGNALQAAIHFVSRSVEEAEEEIEEDRLWKAANIKKGAAEFGVARLCGQLEGPLPYGAKSRLMFRAKRLYSIVVTERLDACGNFPLT